MSARDEIVAVRDGDWRAVLGVVGLDATGLARPVREAIVARIEATGGPQRRQEAGRVRHVVRALAAVERDDDLQRRLAATGGAFAWSALLGNAHAAATIVLELPVGGVAHQREVVAARLGERLGLGDTVTEVAVLLAPHARGTWADLVALARATCGR